MSRRAAGVTFIGFAALLFSTRFITAAIWGQGFSSWNAENFLSLLGYVDHGLTEASVIAIVMGGVYLLWGEIERFKSP